MNKVVEITVKTIKTIIQESEENPSLEKIQKIILDAISIISKNLKHHFSDEEIRVINNLILTEVLITQTISDDDNYITDNEVGNDGWLVNNLQIYDKEWQYWKYYKEQLCAKLKYDEIQKIDRASTWILDLAGNPQRDGCWHRKGMMIGEVQSGKTANYIAVISKAVDVGYRLFIILAGVTDSLRQQTQDRIYRDLRSNTQEPICLTRNADFSRNIVRAVQLNLPDRNEKPLVLVIKKNKSVIDNLTQWIIDNNKINNKFKDKPLMLIDDEADNASVNTNKKNEKDATAINKGIRKLLGLFNKSTYIGCTATPFANIFIDFDRDPEKDRDLFPRNYIYYIKPPEDYIGSTKIFLTNEDKNLFVIEDCIDDQSQQNKESENYYFPIKHKQQYRVKQLPESFKDAICLFILVCAIKNIKKVSMKHNSMLVNVSRFNNVQEQIKNLIEEYLTEILNDIDINGAMENELINSPLARLHKLYDVYYKIEAGIAWKNIKNELNIVSEKGINVELVNQKKQKYGKKFLDYEKHNDIGYSVIAVGGLALSRGLTLEGLSISYVLRNTLMYDALLQMGRWFGYRADYEKYCRIFLSSKAINWYKYVASATNELYEEFKLMHEQRLTPLEFVLKIKKDPNDLLITASSKMRSSTDVKLQSNLWGKIVQSYDIYVEGEHKNNNVGAVSNLIRDLLKDDRVMVRKNQSYLWRNVPVSFINNFISQYCATPHALTTQTFALKKFLTILEQKYKYKDANIALISKQNRSHESSSMINVAENINVNSVQRSFQYAREESVQILNRQLISGTNMTKDGQYNGDILIDFTEDDYNELQKKINIKTNNPEFMIYNAVSECRKHPLLLIYFVDLKRKADNVKTTQQILYNSAPAYALCFPKGTGKYSSADDDVTYSINARMYDSFIDEEDSENGDD